MSTTTGSSSAEVIETFSKYVIPNYGRYPTCLVRGEGSVVWDAEGNRYLDLFPNSRYFIIGFGTNDLGTWSDPEPTSRQIIENLDKMVHAVRDEEKLPLLFNVPYANEPMFSSYIAKDTHEKRDYHNGRLAEYCQQNEVPLADICAYLQDEHLGDELHPNREGAKIIAVEVFKILESLVRGGA